jgi:hypothetical protein
MTATLEGTQKEKADTDTESAPYTAGVLLCELLEAIEVLENHVRLGSNEFTDPELAVATLADHAQRIRQQALVEKLVRPLDGNDGTASLLSIGEALMDADSAVFHAQNPGATRRRARGAAS